MFLIFEYFHDELAPANVWTTLGSSCIDEIYLGILPLLDRTSTHTEHIYIYIYINASVLEQNLFNTCAHYQSEG